MVTLPKKGKNLLTVTDLNIDTAFKLAWASSMRLGEITAFSEIKLRRSEITFAQGDQYACNPND